MLWLTVVMISVSFLAADKLYSFIEKQNQKYKTIILERSF